MICLYLDYMSNTSLSHILVGENPNLLPGPETPDVLRERSGFPICFGVIRGKDCSVAEV